MKPELHLASFDERKETLFKWAIDVRGVEHSQRIIGDNASKAIIDLLSFFLHKKRLVDEGFQLNHSWFKSANVSERLPEFEQKKIIIPQLVQLEQLCEKLSYGAPKPAEHAEKAITLFRELEDLIRGIL